MWSLFGWIRRRRLARRELLRFWDGTVWRYGDPFLLFRALKHHETVTLDTHWAESQEGEEPATTELVTAICGVFRVNRFNGLSGLTDWEVLDLLAQLMDYLDLLKKKHNPSQTSSEPTVSESSTSPVPPSETENSGSASGSTPNA